MSAIHSASVPTSKTTRSGRSFAITSRICAGSVFTSRNDCVPSVVSRRQPTVLLLPSCFSSSDRPSCGWDLIP